MKSPKKKKKKKKKNKAMSKTARVARGQKINLKFVESFSHECLMKLFEYTSTESPSQSIARSGYFWSAAPTCVFLNGAQNPAIAGATEHRSMSPFIHNFSATPALKNDRSGAPTPPFWPSGAPLRAPLDNSLVFLNFPNFWQILRIRTSIV